MFIFLSRCLQKRVINIGDIDYNVCELRLVGMSIQSTVQVFFLSSQSSCFHFDFINRPNVFSMAVVTFGCHF